MASDGSLDTALDGLSGASDYGPQIFALAVQPDGKILAGGLFSFFNGAPRHNLVRLNPDGTLDPSFSNDAQTEGSVRAIALQPDGRILIAGNIRNVNGVARGRLARLHPDGTLDLSFNPGTGFDNTVLALVTDDAGNIYAGGSFLTFNGVARRAIAKLDSAGNPDPAFDPGQGPSNAVYALLLEEGADKIVLGGAFVSYAGSSAGRIVRISTATGARDTTFDGIGSGFNSQVRTLERTADGKYYAGGHFTSFNGVYRGGLARLESNGAIDASFVPTQTGGNELIQSSLLRDGKLLVGGLDLGTWPHPARFLASGERDGTFGVGTGVRNNPQNAYSTGAVVTAMAAQADGKILLGGVFNNFDGTPRIALVRLRADALAFTAVSRKTHGAAGTFDIQLPLTGTHGVECRSGGPGGAHQIILNFAEPVTFDGAFIKGGSGFVASTSGTGTETVTVNLTGVSNQQRITLTLVNATSGAQRLDVNVPMGFLLGDTNGNGTVNASDIGQIKAASGAVVAPGNFRQDVNANGAINASDVSQVKVQSGTMLPERVEVIESGLIDAGAVSR